MRGVALLVIALGTAACKTPSRAPAVVKAPPTCPKRPHPPPAGAIEVGSDKTFFLDDAGTARRRQLRYDLEPGGLGTLDVTTDGTRLPAHVSYDASVVRADGALHLRLEVVSSSAPDLVGATTELAILPDGTFCHGRTTSRPGAQDALESIALLAYFPLWLPREPVGVGARWREIHSIGWWNEGGDATQSIRFTLVTDRDGMAVVEGHSAYRYGVMKDITATVTENLRYTLRDGALLDEATIESTMQATGVPSRTHSLTFRMRR
jgi:hypothetical protein